MRERGEREREIEREIVRKRPIELETETDRETESEAKSRSHFGSILWAKLRFYDLRQCLANVWGVLSCGIPSPSSAGILLAVRVGLAKF